MRIITNFAVQILALNTFMAKKSSGLEFLETPEGLANEMGKAQSFYEKNKNLVLGIGGGLLAIALGVAGYSYYVSSQDEDAQNALFPAIYQMEADSVSKALKGDGANPGLLAIADDYSATKSGKVASFLAGAALMKQGKYDEAIARLEAFSSSDLLLQARVYALLGDAYLEKNNTEEAISYYKKAIDYKPNKYFTPGYLMKLAVAYEKAKQYKEAVEAYTTVIDSYPESPELANAKKFRAAAEGLAGE